MSDASVIKFLRSCVDRMELLSSIDSDGDISIVFSTSDDIPYEMTVFIMEEDGYVGLRAYMFDFEVPDAVRNEVMEVLNFSNADNKFPKAYLQNSHVMTEFWIPYPGGMTVEYVVENIIGPFISASASIYRALFEKLLEPDK